MHKNTSNLGAIANGLQNIYKCLDTRTWIWFSCNLRLGQFLHCVPHIYLAADALHFLVICSSLQTPQLQLLCGV